MGVKISYVITVCDEFSELKRLISVLLQGKRYDDEICVLVDTPHSNEDVINYLKLVESQKLLTFKEDKFEGNFADWKNKANAMASGDFIFNIDADEVPNVNLIQCLPEIIDFNDDIEAYWVPRSNTLDGDKDQILEYIASQGWRVDDRNRINYPDMQLRIFKNSPNVKWEGKVHETVKGFESFSQLPLDDGYSLFHPKTLEKQVKQNNLYNNL